MVGHSSLIPAPTERVVHLDRYPGGNPRSGDSRKMEVRILPGAQTDSPNPVSRFNHRHGGVAQLAARWAHNPEVDGSNPSPATNGAVAKSGLRRLPAKQFIVGSNPTRASNMRSSSNGRTPACQAGNTGSNPVDRSNTIICDHRPAVGYLLAMQETWVRIPLVAPHLVTRYGVTTFTCVRRPTVGPLASTQMTRVRIPPDAPWFHSSVARALACHARRRGFESHWNRHYAEMAELVDALVSEASDESREGSSPSLGTILKRSVGFVPRLLRAYSAPLRTPHLSWAACCISHPRAARCAPLTFA